MSVKQIPAYGSGSWKDSVASEASLPSSGNTTGDTRVARDTGTIYVWSGSAWAAATADLSPYFKKDGSVTMTGNLNLGSYGIVGSGATASQYSIVGGYLTSGTSGQTHSFVWGRYFQTFDGDTSIFAMGTHLREMKNRQMLMGFGLKGGGQHHAIFGTFNVAYTNTSTSNEGFSMGSASVTVGGTDILFQVGNGTSDAARSDALRLNYDGVLWLYGGLKLKTNGGAPRLGTATLVAGTVTVSTTAISANSKVFLSVDTPGGTQGFLSAPNASYTAGTSFVINSSSGTDTSTVNWMIVDGGTA